MNLLHLQYFYVVSKEGGFSKAAHTLRINQPALSRMVKALEENLHMTLLERQPRGVRLTPAGERIFKYAADIFEKVDELKRHAGNLGQICEGELHVGATDAIAQMFLTPAIAELSTTWSQVYPIVQIGSASDLVAKTASGRIELGFLFHLPTLPSSLAVTKRWPVRFHLVCAKSKRRSPEVLRRFIGSREVDDDLNQRFPTLAKWRKKVPEAKISVSSNSLILHRELVKAGTGISVLPLPLIEEDLSSGQLVDLLPNEELRFELKLIQRKNLGPSFNAKTLVDLLSI